MGLFLKSLIILFKFLNLLFYSFSLIKKIQNICKYFSEDVSYFIVFGGLRFHITLV